MKREPAKHSRAQAHLQRDRETTTGTLTATKKAQSCSNRK